MCVQKKSPLWQQSLSIVHLPYQIQDLGNMNMFGSNDDDDISPLTKSNARFGYCNKQHRIMVHVLKEQLL